MLWLRAYLSFVGSFFLYAFGIFNTRAKDRIYFKLCKEKFFLVD